jgi:hypothetical protein
MSGRTTITRFWASTIIKWRQCHHHGSIDDPDALAAYQSTLGS